MKVKGMRWWILALIVLVTVINYLDRNTLGIMWQEIVRDLGLVDASLPPEEQATASKAIFRNINHKKLICFGC